MSLDINKPLGEFARKNAALKLFHVGTLDMDEVEMIAELLAKELQFSELYDLALKFREIGRRIDAAVQRENDKIPF